MSQFEMIATSTFGLESIVKKEIKDLGMELLTVEDGKITFKGDFYDMARANLWLRCADRVLIKLAEFKAVTFEELFQGVQNIQWGQWIDKTGAFVVDSKSVKSTLYSLRDIQSISEKAIVNKLREKYDVSWFEKTGARYGIQVSILKDRVTVTLDTSGMGLHKRGYRQNSVEAPLKETLAAALVKISYWHENRQLLDPFCGSGTIPIEAAMIAKNVAPGLLRPFDAEKWSCVNIEIWKKVKKEAFSAMKHDEELHIVASDIDPDAIENARANAEEAGVDDAITFICRDVADVTVEENHGVMITNPPYGVRIGEKKQIIEMYKQIRRIFRNKKTWSLYMITSDQDLEKTLHRKADKKRKLYNGRLKVDYYQYFGEKPPRR